MTFSVLQIEVTNEIYAVVICLGVPESSLMGGMLLWAFLLLPSSYDSWSFSTHFTTMREHFQKRALHAKDSGTET